MEEYRFIQWSAISSGLPIQKSDRSTRFFTNHKYVLFPCNGVFAEEIGKPHFGHGLAILEDGMDVYKSYEYSNDCEKGKRIYGKKVGEWLYFDSKGVILKREVYDANGKLITVSERSEKGLVLPKNSGKAPKKACPVGSMN